MKGIGIIGTGKHGSRYAEHIINDIKGFQLTAISRRSNVGAKQAKGWGAQFFTDWRDLVCCPEVDAVIAVTVPSMNLEIAKLCAEQGKPLLMEKPLAGNSEEAADIVRIMNDADCSLTVGQTLRYNPVIPAVTSLLPQLGALYSFSVNQRIEPTSLSWHDEPDLAGAGVIIHTAVHIFDALQCITGQRIVRVMATGKCVHSSRLEDLVLVIAEFENGVIGTIDVSKVGKARSGRYEFVCQEGHLQADQIYGFTRIIRNSTAEEKKAYDPVPTILPLLEDWKQFLEGRGENPVTGEDGLYAVTVCDCCLRSYKEQRWVEVEVK